MILAATGLKHEARIIGRPDVIAIAGGGKSDELERLLDAQAPRSSAIISIGLAGALDPMLRPGDWIVDAEDMRWRTFLLEHIPGAEPGKIIGSDMIIATVAAKSDLGRTTGAIACDMESHVVRRVAKRHSLPFAALRVISDGATTDLPNAAITGMRSDGSVNIIGVCASLARNPAQLPALIRIAFDARRAFRSLFRGYDALSRAGIYPTDFGNFPHDVA